MFKKWLVGAIVPVLVLSMGACVEEGKDIASTTVSTATTTTEVTTTTRITMTNEATADEIQNNTYILNTDTKKFHRMNCSYAKKIKDSNRQTFDGSRNQLIDREYSPCGHCDP